MTDQADRWEQGTKILVILAHPDDPEFLWEVPLLVG